MILYVFLNFVMIIGFMIFNGIESVVAIGTLSILILIFLSYHFRNMGIRFKNTSSFTLKKAYFWMSISLLPLLIGGSLCIWLYPHLTSINIFFMISIIYIFISTYFSIHNIQKMNYLEVCFSFLLFYGLVVVYPMLLIGYILAICFEIAKLFKILNENKKMLENAKE